MSGLPKKDSSIMIRLAGEVHAELSTVGKRMNIPPAQIVRALIESYVHAHAEHEGNLPWPPRFQYYDHAPVHDPRTAAAGKGATHASRVDMEGGRFGDTREINPDRATSSSRRA